MVESFRGRLRRLRDVFDENGDVEFRAYGNEALRCLRAGAARGAFVLGWCSIAYVMRRHTELLIGYDRFNESLRQTDSGRSRNFAELREVMDGHFLRALYHTGLIAQDSFDLLKEYRKRRNDGAHVKDLRLNPITIEEGLDLLEYGVRMFVSVQEKDSGFVPPAFMVDAIRDLDYPIESRAQALIDHARREDLVLLAGRLLEMYLSPTDAAFQERVLMVWHSMSQGLNKRERAAANRQLASLLPEADQNVRIEQLVERVSLRPMVFMSQLSRISREYRCRIIKALVKETSMFFPEDRDFVEVLMGYAEGENYQECARLLAEMERSAQ